MLIKIALALVLFAGSASAQDYMYLPEGPGTLVGPSTTDLIIGGGITAVIDYFAHITVHELAHSAAAKYYGADITRFTILPSKRKGEWHLGYMTYEYEAGSMSDRDHAVVSFAPSAVSLGYLGLYSAVFETGLMPDNKYAKLGLSIIALYAAVDVGSEVFNLRDSGDFSQTFELLDYSSSQKLGARIAIGVLVGGALIEIGRVLLEVFVSPSEEEYSRNFGEPYMLTNTDTIGLGWRLGF